MQECIKSILRPLWHGARIVLRSARRANRRHFNYSESLYWNATGGATGQNKETSLAWIVIQYHVIEKGLTMPNRHLAFGKTVLCDLMLRIETYLKQYDSDDRVLYAIGVVKAYYELHAENGYDFSDDVVFWQKVQGFLDAYGKVPVSRQIHTTKTQFYSSVDEAFPQFARSRHTVRHYSGQAIDIKTIGAAVELAMTAPSACNRQHTRVRCIANKELVQKVLALQGGNRGFGHLADKVLVVSGDMRDEVGPWERNDVYINGGIFLMNLCYALHYHKIAHCILSCAFSPEKDKEVRTLIGLPESEAFVAMISCGIAPEEFDVAASPRRKFAEIFSIV